MAILDIFRKKKKEKKPAVADSASVGEENKFSSSPFAAARVGKEDKSSSSPFAAARVKEVKFGQSYNVLKKPHVTEKAGDLVEKNQYIFRIFSRANKTETKKAIEDVYGVDVVSVKIINVPEKKRRLGKIQGRRPGYKKAIVKIKKGQKIEVLPR